MSKINKVILLGLILSVFLNLFLVQSLLSPSNRVELMKESQFKYAFSQLVSDPKILLLESINGAEEQLDIAIYNFEDLEIAEAVMHAASRGVRVRVVTDEKKASKEKNSSILDNFTANDIAVKVNVVRKMHLKMVIVDQQQVTFGSYNYTKDSANENIEQLVTITNADIGEKWSVVFNKLWDGAEFTSWE